MGGLLNSNPTAVRFSGAQDLRRNASLPDDIAVTVCGWATLQVDRNDFSSLCTLEAGASSSQGMYLQTTADGTSLVLSANTGGATDSASVALVVGQPFFWAMVSSALTGANSLLYYRNYQAKTLTANAQGGTRTAYTPGALFIGSSSFGEFWNGDMWDVMVWNRALSARELLLQSFSHVPINTQDLNLFYPLNRADSIKDLGPNRRDPTTITGTLLTSRRQHVILDELPKVRGLYYKPGGTQSYSYTPTGGITFGGAAGVNKVRAVSAAGGIQFGGAATALRIRVAVSAGGIQFGGAALFAKGKTVVPSGGIQFGGAAVQLRNRVVLPTGGIVFGGSAPYSSSGAQSYSYTATGGIQFGGAAVVNRVAVRVTVGGITFGGAAAVAFHESTRTVSAAGGIQFGGAASVSFVTAGGATTRVRRRDQRKRGMITELFGRG